MRLKLLLPKVEPGVFEAPRVCPNPKCGGQQFHLRQEVRKPVRDTVLHEVRARRYECLRCGQTLRVYPLGITADQTSLRLKGLAVLFYIMGLSYGAVALVLSALGHPLGKTAAYEAVQAAGQKVAGLRREEVRASAARVLVAALGVDLTSVKCKGEWLTVGVTTGAIAGTTLTIDLLENGEADTLRAWIHEVAEAGQAEVLVTDDADGFKTAADDNGLQHQVCKSHVVRNSEAWHDAMQPELAHDADGSLAALGVTPEQALADNDELLRLMHERQPSPEADAKLEEIAMRYAQAAAPRKQGQDKQTVAYRMRLFSLDRWNLWRRLTRYRHWRSAQGECMDGTNNATERAIGWRIKERYRTMRGYKRRASVLNVNRLIAWAGKPAGCRWGRLGPGARLRSPAGVRGQCAQVCGPALLYQSMNNHDRIRSAAGCSGPSAVVSVSRSRGSIKVGSSRRPGSAALWVASAWISAEPGRRRSILGTRGCALGQTRCPP